MRRKIKKNSLLLNPKEIILGILTAAVSVSAFWFWKNSVGLVAEGNFGDYLNFALPVGGLVAAAVIFSLAALFIKNPWVIYGSGVLGIGVPFLLVEAKAIVVSALIFSIFLIFLAIRRIRKDFHLSLGFSLHKTTKTGLPLFFSISSLLVATYYLSTLTEEKAISSLLPKPAFNVSLKVLAGPLQDISGLPVANLDSTVDEVLTKLLEDELKKKGVSVSQTAKGEFNRMISAQRAELAKNFGIKLSGQEKLSDVFYNTVSVKIQDLLGPYKPYIPYASAIALFLAFKTFTLPLFYISMLITFVLIRLMVATNILKVEKQSIEVERLTL